MRVSAIPVMLALILLFLALFAGIFSFFLVQGTQQTADGLRDRSAAAANIVATNASWISEVAQQTLRRADMAWGPSLSSPGADMEPVVGTLPAQTELSIANRDAVLVFSTLGDSNDVPVADRAYFSALRDGAPFHISSLLSSRLRGEDVFVFSKRMEREGEFAGAAIVSFPASILNTFWESLDLPLGSTISLIRTDGMLIARFPPTDGPLDLSGTPLFTEHLPAAATGTYFPEESPSDNLSRVESYRTVPGTGIIALASIAAEETWGRFHGAIVAVFLIMSPIILGLIAGSIWIIQLLMRDAERKRELEAALDANRILFREIHHRVKNNLQSVQSLVALQNIPLDAKRDLGARLAAMAAMHEHIYQADRFAEINAHDYVPVIVNEVVQAYGKDCKVTYDVDHLTVDRDHATPLALLLSELATNACKYAFADGRQGELHISVKAAGTGRADITVSDNGVGLSEDRTLGMGTRLLQGLSGQMGGSYTLTTDGGTHFKTNLALETIGHAASSQPRQSAPDASDEE